MILRAMFAGSAILFLMSVATGSPMLIALRPLQGAFTGTVTAASAFVAANTPKKHLSYAIGVLSSASFLGFAIGPVLGGISGDLFGFRLSFVIGRTLLALGAILVFFALQEDPENFGRIHEGPKKK